MKEVTRDKMPREVATEMLCSPGVRMSNRERKAYRAARQKEFVADTERKPVESKIRARLASRPLEWLLRQKKRCDRRRRGLQGRYESLRAKEQTPLIARAVAALNLHAAMVDLWLDGIDDAVKARR